MTDERGISGCRVAAVADSFCLFVIHELAAIQGTQFDKYWPLIRTAEGRLSLAPMIGA
jgi:hypothetical protein